MSRFFCSRPETCIPETATYCSRIKESEVGRFFKWIGITFGGLFAFLFITAMGFGVATEVGVFPATLVQTGDELPKKQHEALKEANIVDRDEVIKFYYFEGLFDPTFGGSVMTDRRIIGYWTEDEKVEVLAFPLESLNQINMNVEGDFITDAEYVVWQRDDDENSLLLFLSVEEERHLEMVAALKKQISENNARFAETSE